MSQEIALSVGLNQRPGFLELNDPLFKEIAESVQFFLRDFAELNRLTKGRDHNDRHVKWAILDTISDWKSTPPFIGQDLNMIVGRGWQSIFIRGVCASLLESLGYLHMRNYLAYSDGGVNVQTENPQMIQAALSMLKNEYEQKKLKVLIAANIESAMIGAGVHSELLFVNSFWGSL